MPEFARMRAEGKYGAVKNNLEQCPLICLDDVGAREMTGPQSDALLYFMNMRGTKPLIITGNYAPGKLAAFMDDRIVSRICSGVVIEVEGDDRRLENAIVLKA